MTTAIESALKDLDNVFPAGEDGFYYQGQELAGKECKEVPAFQHIIGFQNVNLRLQRPKKRGKLNLFTN